MRLTVRHVQLFVNFDRYSVLSHKQGKLTCRLSLRTCVIFLIRARVFITLRSCLVVPNVFCFPFLLRPREIEGSKPTKVYSRLAIVQWDWRRGVVLEQLIQAQ